MNLTHKYYCGLREIKDLGAGSSEMIFSGYGAVFGNVDAYGDVIVKGAFAESIAAAKSDENIWPSLLLQHGGWGMDSLSMTPVGVWLDLREDDYGLYVEGKFNPESERGREAYGLLKMTPRPGIKGLSIGYNIPDGGQERPKQPISPKHVRNITKVNLGEVSLVTFPANNKARVSAVKMAPDKRYLEKLLCDAGLSRSQAKSLIAEGYNAAFKTCDESEAAEVKQLMKKFICSLRGA